MSTASSVMNMALRSSDRDRAAVQGDRPLPTSRAQSDSNTGHVLEIVDNDWPDGTLHRDI